MSIKSMKKTEKIGRIKPLFSVQISKNFQCAERAQNNPQIY